MADFAFVYRAPTTYDGASQSATQAWQAFFDKLGAAVVDAGNPVFARQQVGECGHNTVLGGYSIINAADLSAATALARECPLIAAGGGVEVGELTLLNPASLHTTADDHATAIQR